MFKRRDCGIYPMLMVALLLSSPVFAASDVVIVGATTDGIAINTTSGTISYPLVVLNTKKTANPVSVTVAISDLVGPDAKPYSRKLTTPEGASGASVTVNVPSLGTVMLTLDAQAPSAGLYQASVIVNDGASAVPVVLKINRTSVAPTVKVPALDTAAFGSSIDIFTNPSLRFSIQETAGATVTMLPPVLTSLTVKRGDKTVQARFDGAKVYREDVSPAALVAAPFQLTGSSSAAIRVDLEGLKAPGEYAATFAIASPDGALTPQALPFFIRLPVWIAALLIAIGVVISTQLRKYTQVDRPRLLRQRKILLLAGDLEVLRARTPDAADQELLDGLLRRLKQTEADIIVGVVTAIDEIATDINQKLSLVPVFSTLRKKIGAAQPPSAADPQRSVLSRTRELILANSNSTTAQITAARADLDTAITAIDAQVRAQLAKQVEDLQTSIANTAATLTPDHKAEFERDVTGALKGATEAAESSPPDIGKANQLIDAARRAAARIMVNDLAEKLVKPEQMDAAAWDPLLARFTNAADSVRAATDGEAAMSAYRQADEAWLSAAIEAAATQANGVQQRASATTDPALKEWAGTMKIALEGLLTAKGQIRNGELAAARKAFNTSVASIAEGLKALPAAPVENEGPEVSARRLFSLAESPELTIPGLIFPPHVDSAGGRAERVFVSVTEIDDEIKKRDRIISFIVGGVAVFLGIFLLWVDNLAWGSYKDLAAAVLWGLGLHQISGNAMFAKLDLAALESQLAPAPKA